MADLYVYRAELAEPPHGGDSVYDGDTYWLWIDTGFDQWFRDKFRSKRIDTPELRYGSDHEKEQGQLAKEFAEQWFDEGEFLIRTFKASQDHHVDERGRYRWLGEPIRPTAEGEDALADRLVEEGLATFWPTRWRDQYDQ